MKDWLSVKAIIELGVSGMPGTERGVRMRAQSDGWITRKERGRTKIYINSLPKSFRAELRAALCARELAATLDASEPAKAGMIEGRKLQLKEKISDQAAHNQRLEGLKQSISLPEKDQRRMDAKLEIARAADVYAKNRGLPIRRAYPEFAHAYNAHQIEIADSVRKLMPRVCASSIHNWRRKIKKEGINRLAGSYTGSKGRGTIDAQPAVRDLVVGLLVTKPHARATHVMQALQARFDGTETVLPSMRSLERWIKQWKKANAQTFLAIANPDAWKNYYLVAFGSHSEGITRLNQRWEMDSTPADVMLKDGRYSIIGAIDVYSRNVMLFVSKTSKATAIAALVRRALLAWGVPEEVKTDNGSDYVGHHMTRVFDSLEIEHTQCLPFQPMQKPHIERFFRTFSHGLMEMLDSFIGHNVAERKSIEARRSFADRLMSRSDVIEINLSAAEFQEFCDRWCKDIYLHQPHDGLRNRSPFEVLAAWREPVRVITDERALDILLAEAPDNHGRRTVRKKGIEVQGAWFIAPELEAFVGQLVRVFFDPQDLGHIIVYGGLDEQFICIAKCPERTGIDRQEAAAIAKAMQKNRVQEERRALKAVARSVKTDDVVDEILRHSASISSKLHLFPQPIEAHESNGLKAATEAAAARRALTEPPCLRELTDKEREIQQELIADLSRPKVKELTKAERYVRAYALERRLGAELPVEERDREWLASYQTCSEYRALKSMRESFGLDPFADSYDCDSNWQRYQALTTRADLTDEEITWMRTYETDPQYCAYAGISDALTSKPKPAPDQEALDRGGVIVMHLTTVAQREPDDDDWPRYQELSRRNDLTDAEVAWMRNYETTPEYRANAMVSRALGAKS